MPSFLTHTCACPSRTISDECGDDYRGVMVVGEAGGYHEDRTGHPFAGESGLVLNRLLELAGLTREQVYITNTVQHRPPGNKTPSKAQVEFHRPMLQAAIDQAKPSTVIAVGAIALAWFRPKPTLTACHGKAFNWRGVTIVPVFHPAYAMRNPSVWPLLHQDFTHLFDPIMSPTFAIYHQGSEESATAWAYETKRIGFDLETTDTKINGVFYPHLQQILGYSMSWGSGLSMYVPKPPGVGMKAVLEDPGVTKVCHNAKFEYQLLRGCGITLRNFEDTKLKAYLLQYPSTRLKDLSYQILNIEQLHLEDVTHGRPTSEVTTEEWVPYAAADADCTLQLDDRLSADLEREGLTKLYREFELPLIPILAEAERCGGLIDPVPFETLAGTLHARLAELEVELQQWFPGVNLNSPDKLSEVVFSKEPARFVATQELKTRTHIRFVPLGLGLKSKKRTPGGKPALDKEVMAALEDKHPAMKRLAEYHYNRDYLSDFVEKIPAMCLEDSTIHPSLNQTGGWEDTNKAREAPANGRFSASDPNIMQMPKRDAVIAKAVRRGFVARPGYTWLSADMRQQEPRISAVVSGDERYQSDFEAGVDVYMEVAHEVKKAVTKDATARVTNAQERDAWGLEYRDTAKNKVLLPVTYGAGVPKLVSIYRGLTFEAASGILNWLRNKYPKLVEYAKVMEQSILETGYAITLFGRKRWLPGIWVKQSRAEAARQGANHPISGTGADVLKGCIIYLWGPLGKLLPYDAHLLWPVHDAVDMEVKTEQVKEVVEIVRNMTEWFDRIKLPVEVRVGPNWGELKEV